MSTVDRLRRWIHAAKFRREAVEVALLRQVRRGMESIQVFDWLPDEFDAAALAAELWETATVDASTLGGRSHAFTARAQNAAGEGVADLVFRITIQGELAAGKGSEDEPDESGLTRQLMRHNEAMMRLLVGSIGGQLQSYQATVEHLSAQVVTLEQSRAELAEQASSQSLERLLIASHAKEQEGEAELHKEMGLKLIKWGEVIASQFMRKQGVLTEGVPESIKAIVGGLNPDQIEKLLTILTPEQAAQFGELYLAVRDEMGANGSGKQ